VRRALFLCLFALGLAVAGSMSAVVIAGTGTTTVTTGTTTTAPGTTVSTATGTAPTSTAATTTAATTTATTTAATTTAATTTAAARSDVVPADVRVAGVNVGGLSPAAAVTAVQEAFAEPLAVVVDRSKLELEPTSFATAYAALAVAKARASTSPAAVSLTVNVNGSAVRAWVAKLAKRFDRSSVDASVALVKGTPSVTPDRVGRHLDATVLTRSLVSALESGSRTPVRTKTQAIAPTVSTAQFGPEIVINRSLNRLQLFNGRRLVRQFPVATGQAIYPTPKGTFHIIVKWKNPWWYPPTQDAWAKGLQPVPPGPDNPLGTRWMGLSVPGVGIHGTDEPGSIGYSESHGCIRMEVPDAEWLFDRVNVGTTVFIL
jgi:lipoprotein-anchoring transpeptidase ErfK/SrfK